MGADFRNGAQQTLLSLSNVAALGAVAFASVATWSHSAYENFVRKANPWFWLCLLFSEHFFKLVMVAMGAKTTKKVTDKTTFAEASQIATKSMRSFTTAFDYLFVLGVFLFFLLQFLLPMSPFALTKAHVHCLFSQQGC